MREREEIWQEREFKGRADESLVLEVLLDIRDLLLIHQVSQASEEEIDAAIASVQAQPLPDNQS